MGYETYVTGGFKIKPRLPDAEIEELNMHVDGESDLYCSSEGEEDTVELIDGTITVVPGDSWTAAEPRFEEPYKAYDLEGAIHTLVAVANKHGAIVTGAVYCDGEDDRDFSRFRVEDGKVVHEVPTLVWPNGDEGWA